MSMYNTRKQAADKEKEEREAKESKRQAIKKITETNFKRRNTKRNASDKYQYVFILPIKIGILQKKIFLKNSEKSDIKLVKV